MQREHGDRALDRQLEPLVLDRLDRVLEARVVELHHVRARRRPSPVEAAREVDVDDVKAAEPRPRSSACDVDDHLIADLGAADQRDVGDRRARGARRRRQLDAARCSGAAALLGARRAARDSASTTMARRSFSIGAASYRPRPAQSRRLVQQRQRDVEHLLERRHAHALAGLVVALGAVGEVDRRASPARAARWRRRRRRSRSRTGSWPQARSAASAARTARRRRRQAVAGERALHADVDVAVAVGQVRGLVQAVDDLGDQRLGALVVEAAHLGHERAAFGDDVDRAAAGDRAHVDGRLLVEAAEAHRGDRARGREDRAAALLGADARVRRRAAEARPRGGSGVGEPTITSPIGEAWSKT